RELEPQRLQLGANLLGRHSVGETDLDQRIAALRGEVKAQGRPEARVRELPARDELLQAGPQCCGTRAGNSRTESKQEQADAEDGSGCPPQSAPPLGTRDVSSTATRRLADASDEGAGLTTAP